MGTAVVGFIGTKLKYARWVIDEEWKLIVPHSGREPKAKPELYKIVEDPFGQLTFLRLYQGKIEKGQMYFNQRNGRKQRFSRIVRMHADGTVLRFDLIFATETLQSLS